MNPFHLPKPFRKDHHILYLHLWAFSFGLFHVIHKVVASSIARFDLYLGHLLFNCDLVTFTSFVFKCACKVVTDSSRSASSDI